MAFVADIQGRRSHETVQKALTALRNLLHRGATGSDSSTGDGAGILIQTPHRFLVRECRRLGFPLPPAGEYAAGMVFLPRDPEARQACERIVEAEIRRAGQAALGWRDVPCDNSRLGAGARAAEPVMRQVLVGRGLGVPDDAAFERRLYLIRRRVEQAVAATGLPEREGFYITSLSARTLVYKGMLSADQLPVYFSDLHDPELESALAVVHQRFSTNTFPTWSLAHPFRILAHNGEINTLRGNINWMRAREQLLESELFGDDLGDLLPVIQEEGSDSAILDNVLELLVMTGRSLPHAMMMLVPEPWSGHDGMNEVRKAFYNYHSSLMEPWDGPAAITFTDGRLLGAVLDRNGLRPARYYVLRDDTIIMASEVGVLDIAPEEVVHKGRLEPGRMLLIDTEAGRIIGDSELKSQVAAAQPYGRWLAEHRIHIDALPLGPTEPPTRPEDMLRLQRVFGYTQEEVETLILPMARDAEEALGSMGTDTPLAALSNRPQLLYSYFKQLFAQVTNPPLDALREALVTSVDVLLGPERNLLAPEPESCRQIEAGSPVLSNPELAKLRHISLPGLKSRTLPMLFPAGEGNEGLVRAVDELCARAEEAMWDGCNLLILSDRGVDRECAPIPAVLATAAVHHHLVRAGARAKAGLIIETGEAHEVHHLCLLLGYGAGAINPYLAFDTVHDLVRAGDLPGLTVDEATQRYIKAVNKGILKVISKMGISTLQSYGGAQIFEAVGLDQRLVDRYFTGTPSRIGGVGIDVIAKETLARHRTVYAGRRAGAPAHHQETLEWGGQYAWRRDGEYHLFNPQTVFKLQHATQSGQYRIFKEYSDLVNGQVEQLATIRGLLELQYAERPVPLEDVEPAEEIIRRFATGAMSFGSISAEAHETLAIAMNSLGGKSNTGEGGEDPARFVRDQNGDWRRSAIKQVASARFGVTSEYLVQAEELQIKMAQGAKPGEGGQLPGHKVYGDIARVRHSTPGVGLISPPPHHDIYSIEDLAQLIHDLKAANPRARVSVKLVAEVGVGTVAAGVAKAHADVVLISGHDGGTGASPLTSIKHAGVPWELGLAETQQTLVRNGLRDRIIVQTDGQLKTGRDVVVAALLGAEEYGFATAPLVVMGCIMMRVCHLNTCPVGIATQDPELRKRFAGKPEFVENFFLYVAEEVRELMSRLGFRTMDEMVGRVDKLSMARAVGHYKARGLDLTALLHVPDVPPGAHVRRVRVQDHGLDRALDNALIELARPALERGAPVRARLPIRNVDRAVGTMLGSELTRRYGGAGLPDGTVELEFTGSAGQSFGAFIPRGLSLTLEGDANDGVGKGLSGGRIVIYPPRTATQVRTDFAPEENVLLGNVALYGATSGEAYFNGMAGERFAVRNSGACAVVEGVGDHGCEYMTGGRVVVLGPTGRNFAAGMSGGIAYVLDEDGRLEHRCNRETVGLGPPDTDEDEATIRTLLERHLALTGSPRARRVLADWGRSTGPHGLGMFVKVIPHEYRRVLEGERREISEERAAVVEARHA